ncbi:hypothetical protein QR98_0048880 [Sarcoptes scabiei]|uniref:Uncharacterized protein n=1 Tax=Sarcoptes scabiei TaxID=52283 RepID=A0A132A604_SARSC|nr:hypothetical protein QR98_0048880 [Sarcoptes scabiei]
MKNKKRMLMMKRRRMNLKRMKIILDHQNTSTNP